jgi:lipopolysaccharide transport system permease protein
LKNILKINSILSVSTFRVVLYNILLRLKNEKNQFLFGYLWWFVEPLIYAVAFYVLSIFLNRGISFEFIVIGKLAFLWFSKSFTGIVNSTSKYKSLIQNHEVNVLVAPMIELGLNLIKHLVILIVLIIYFNIYKQVSIEYLKLLTTLITSLIFFLSSGLIFLIIRSLFKDVINLIPPILLSLMFLSGIFFDILEMSNEFYRNILLEYNPLALILILYRDAIYLNIEQNFYENLLIFNSFFIVIIFICHHIIKKNNKFIEYYN